MSNETVQALLQKLKHLTADVLQRLQFFSEEEFETFAAEREGLVAELMRHKSQITEADRRQIAELLDSDPIILSRMHFLKDEAGNWLERKGAVRVQQHAYQRDYTPDSLFFDHRK